jgi:hypothetical protein
MADKLGSTPAEEKRVASEWTARSLLLGMVTAVGFGLGGFFLLRDDMGYMGGVLFLALPSAAGFATALVGTRRDVVVASLILGAMLCTCVLLVAGLEGLVCVIMSAPLILGGMTAGAVLGWHVRKRIQGRSNHPRAFSGLLLLMLPVLLAAAGAAERRTRETLRAETITDTLVVSQSPEAVWDQLRSMSDVTASKGFLMKIGLPVPVSCTTDGERAGGTRTCYFESGHVVERITEWEFPTSMRFEIVECDVPGRPWLTFQDAGYEIERVNDQTVITRYTTIVSRLAPAWYWRPLEAIGVHTVHEYLFEAVAKKLTSGR